MNPWIGKTAFLLGMLILVAIRVPHDKRSKETNIAESRKGPLEATLLALMGIGGFVFPLYAAIFVYALAQALLLSNWMAGPGCLMAFVLMLVFRLRPEERMMLEKFGQPYQDYVAKTKRLIPGIW